MIIGHRRFLIRLTRANATDMQIHAMRFWYPVIRWPGNSTRREITEEKVHNIAELQKY